MFAVGESDEGVQRTGCGAGVADGVFGEPQGSAGLHESYFVNGTRSRSSSARGTPRSARPRCTSAKLRTYGRASATSFLPCLRRFWPNHWAKLNTYIVFYREKWWRRWESNHDRSIGKTRAEPRT